MELILAGLLTGLIVGSCLYVDIRLAFFILISCSCVGGCSYINQKVGLKNDHQAEQFIELIIEKETGIRIDLTPEDIGEPIDYSQRINKHNM
tara:strand:+ start:753 stop:1028 length:276 start_codon:yes stop_codon:yes gene_type:complete